MTALQSAVPLRIAAAVDEVTGEVVDAGPLIGWLLDLVADMPTELMGRCWRPETFASLHAGVDGLGRKLPSTAAVVAAVWGGHPLRLPGCMCPRGLPV